MNKTLLTTLVIAIVVGGGAFYGGMKYAESTRPNFVRPNLGGQELGANTGDFRNRTGGQQMGGSASGEIIAEDDKSVTIKLRARPNFAGQNLGGQDGGSRIVFFSDSTEITKSVSGTQNDLEIGKSVVINGKPNQDGSITAESIQLRSNPQ
ncbi:hypothetical protein KJ636_00515 [Patescibacteria group bacterium]|nr:hypothetical protein [Patescibacteria group bacterium]MBU4481636.1 hypothetical protein [Patescibacteria group bacterium]